MPGTHKGIDPVEGSSEDVEGVTVKHRFLHNEGVKIHYVEAGNPNGKLVSGRSNAHVLILQRF